jgi:hypothetical protein
MTAKTTRVDDVGWAYAGSQLQIQIYVNRWSEELPQEVIQGLSDLALLHPHLNLVSPLEKDYFKEHQDTGGLQLASAITPTRGSVLTRTMMV